jgi:hypothetical protein
MGHQQPVSHVQPEGHRQLRFRAPMTTSSQQGQTGNPGNTFGNIGVGPGRGAPSFVAGESVSQRVNSEALLVLRGSSSQLRGFGKTQFRTQELEEVCSQAVAKGNLLRVGAVADQYCQDRRISESLLDTYNDMIQRVTACNE